MPLLWAHILITVVCLSLTFILMYLIKKRDGNMARLLTVYMTLFVTAFGIFYVAVSRGHSSIRDAQLYAERNTNGRWNMEFKLEDGERIDTINTETNAAMYWNMPSIRAFHSVVPGSIFDFYKNIGVTRDVKTEPPYDNYALQSLLSVRYLIDGENNADAEHEHMTFLRTDNGNSIYEYEYYIPMGFTYTEYMTRSELMANYVDVFRDDVMLSTLVVEDDQADPGRFRPGPRVGVRHPQGRPGRSGTERAARSQDGRRVLDRQERLYLQFHFRHGGRGVLQRALGSGLERNCERRACGDHPFQPRLHVRRLPGGYEPDPV